MELLLLVLLFKIDSLVNFETATIRDAPRLNIVEYKTLELAFEKFFTLMFDKQDYVVGLVDE